MKWEKIARTWPSFNSLAKRQWAELSNEQLRNVAGRRAWLVDSLQECYCLSRDMAEREVDEWIETFGDIDEVEDLDGDSQVKDDITGRSWSVSYVDRRIDNNDLAT